VVGLPIESSYISCSNFRRFGFRDTGCFNAENHILPTPLAFDLEFEGHAVGMRRRNLGQKLESIGCHMVKKSVIVGRTAWAQCTSVRRTDRHIYDD